MFNIDVLNSFLKDIFMNILIFYVFLKMTNYKDIDRKDKILVTIFSILLAILYAILIVYVDFSITNIIHLFIYSLLISYITKKDIIYIFATICLSAAITFSIFVVSSIINGIIFNILFSDLNNNNPIGIFMITFMQTIFIYYFFKIKRFKKGFAFLQKESYIKNINIFGPIASGIVIIIYFIGEFARTRQFKWSLAIGIILIATGIIFWIRKQITHSYKQMLKEDTIKQLEEELEIEKQNNEKITHELEIISAINHKYTTRISALENCVKNLNNKYSLETSEELSNITELVDNLSKEYNEEISKEFKNINKLPKTDILGIDNIINYMQTEANKNNIELNVKINGNVHELIEKYIPENKLETLLGDHIKDAIIAIKHSDSKNRKIMVEFNVENYEIKFYDTGIEFEIETLHKLGLERTTTHKLTGGSGIGFMTTFETLRDCRASLIIEEYGGESKDYTKAVIIRFDGKNEYKICSYRAEEIEAQRKDGRIIIEKVI